jgi:hypothetical protein
VEKDEEGGNAEEIDSFLHNRSGARLHYLAAGVLIGQERHREAIAHLERAIRNSRGWSGLEITIRRMLLDCYEKHKPVQAGASSTTLDTYFNVGLPPRDLIQALDDYTASKSGVIRWSRNCIDESDSSVPFTFSVTFPGITHATAGDTVTASVFIMSNLDYAVHLKSVTLRGMAGEIPVALELGTNNANDKTNRGVIIREKSSILLTTQIDLPRTLDEIAESEKVGDKEPAVGKTSNAKSARPRSAAITSAGKHNSSRSIVM